MGRLTQGKALFQPKDFAALASMDIIVEGRECLVPGITAELQRRFAATHDVVVVHDDGQRQLHDPPEWFRALVHLDPLLAVWEWRSGATPWLVMRACVFRRIETVGM